MNEPPKLVDDDEEEITEVTHEIRELRVAKAACRDAAARIVRTLTPPGPMRAVHVHVAECWDRYEPCGAQHEHTWTCGTGALSSRCPERKEEELTTKA